MLSDGGTVHVRPVRPSDADALVAMHARLSPESIYFRFFSPKPRLTDKEIERFTTVDFYDRVALVAMLGDDMVAVARFDRWQQEDEAEVAFTVDDAHHGRGFATVMLSTWPPSPRGWAAGSCRGVARHRPMLGVFCRGLRGQHAFSSGIIDAAFDLDPTSTSSSRWAPRQQRADPSPASSRPKVGGRDRRQGPASVGQAVFRNLLGGGFSTGPSTR